MEPWVQTVAASTEDRIIAVSLDLTSEASPPANTQDIPLRPGGAPLPTENLVDVPLIKSPNFANGSTDGCSAYPPGTFTRGGSPTDRIFADGFDDLPPPPISEGAVAVLHLDGTSSACGSGGRRTAALNAGAIGVIFVDSAYLNLGAANTSWSMLMSDWLNLEAGSNPATARVSIDISARAFPAQGDVIADFSFRGPRLVGGQGMVKPDITGPGVDILAVGAANVVGPNGVYLSNGTSMSSPHMAGAAALMRALNPTWSATQVKSALNLSSNNFGAVNQDGSPVRLWDYGSGRVNLTAASKVGLIMDETAANFLAANPATGGDIASLNLASMAKANFVGDAVFTRTFRRARSGSQTYTLSVVGFPAGAVDFSPASFNINSTGSRTITVTAHGAMLPSSQWSLGELILTPSAGDEPTLHLPIALNPAGPIIDVTPASISDSSDTTVSNDLTISNTGNPTLNWSVTTTGTAQVTPLNTTTSGSGQLGGYYIADSEGDYISQNFDTRGATHVTTLRANGFTLPGGSSLTAANTPSVTFSVYADNAGEPAGAPEGFGSAPLWTYTNTIGAANGITTTGGNLQLNLAAAGVPPLDLPAGRHWMTVYPTITASSASLLWAWRTSPDPTIGNVPLVYAPYFDNTQFYPFAGVTAMSAFVQGTVDCSLPSWVNLTTTSGSLGFGGSQAIPVGFDAAGLAAGTYTATLCIGSNATNLATVAVPLTFTVPTGGSQAPTVSKAFAPSSVETNATSTLTITLNNAGPAVSTLSVDLTDTFPAGLVVAATPAASTTCASGTLTAVAGSGSVTLGTGAQIPAAGSCTVSVDVASATADVYNNSIAAGALQTDTGNNAAAANASLTVTAPVFIAPTTAVAFAPTSVSAGTATTVTITLGNTNAVAANLTAALDDSLPAGLLVAPTPNAASTCASGTVTAAAGTSLVSLASGAQIPASGDCTVTVDVRAVSPGTYTNTIAAGALQTDLGNSTAAGSDALTVTAATFPAPYCPRAFTSAVEPITLVNFANINNVTSEVVDGTPALEDFLAQDIRVVPGATYKVTV
ncbi:MAG TPA: S8 family serine peptidase, partial [Dokdonella sp.]